MYLRDYQQQLTDYIRGKSEYQPFERADTYRELMQHNIVSFIGDNRPDLKEALGKDFEGFVLEYFRDWSATTVYFYRIMDEFNAYCESLVAQKD